MSTDGATNSTTDEFDLAYRFLRSNSVADFRFDEHIVPIKYVITHDGLIATPVMTAMLQTLDTVLFIPEASEDALEIMVSVQQFEETEADGGRIADRWRIYHGEPDDVCWATMLIDCIRYAGLVFDGEAFMQQNLFAADEAGFCRTMNAEARPLLSDLCKVTKDIEVPDPVCVGIDPLGIDIRARFGIVRVPVEAPAENVDELRKELEDLARAAS